MTQVKSDTLVRRGELCAVPECPNEAVLFHPDRYVGLCRDHPNWIMAFGIVGDTGDSE